MLEKTLESPLDSKEIKWVNLRGNKSWIFIGTSDAKAEAPILWPPDAKRWLIGKDAGKDWQRLSWLDGITDSMDMSKLEQTLGDSEGQGSLACCGPWESQKFGHDWATEQLPFRGVWYIKSLRHFRGLWYNWLTSYWPLPLKLIFQLSLICLISNHSAICFGSFQNLGDISFLLLFLQLYSSTLWVYISYYLSVILELFEEHI